MEIVNYNNKRSKSINNASLTTPTPTPITNNQIRSSSAMNCKYNETSIEEKYFAKINNLESKLKESEKIINNLKNENIEIKNQISNFLNKNLDNSQIINECTEEQFETSNEKYNESKRKTEDLENLIKRIKQSLNTKSNEEIIPSIENYKTRYLKENEFVSKLKALFSKLSELDKENIPTKKLWLWVKETITQFREAKETVINLLKNSNLNKNELNDLICHYSNICKLKNISTYKSYNKYIIDLMNSSEKNRICIENLKELINQQRPIVI